MKQKIIAILLVLGLTGVSSADTLFGHARAMWSKRSIWHDRSRRPSAEVVAKVKPGFGQYARAMAAWHKSKKGHAQILASKGRLRVFCFRGYCVGRK